MKPFRLPILLIVVWLAASCAKQGYPSGGPVDRQPPEVKGVSPASESTNYSAKKFRIDFDEYVTMKDVDNNVLISPPMSSKPEYTTKGHSLIVKLTDTLAANTTYLFQFKGAIVDFNEGNALPSFEYVFSTGDLLDSMTISGKVLDALTQNAPETPVTVMAYEKKHDNDTLGDSIVAKTGPTYQTRTSSDGTFEFNYIRPAEYKIIALDDADRNLRYSASEGIAWLDTAVSAWQMPRRTPDSSGRGQNVQLSPDSTAEASIQPSSQTSSDTQAIGQSNNQTNSQPILLNISLKEVAQQRVLAKQFADRGCVQIVTQCPMHNPTVESDSIVWNLCAKRDTLNIWTLRQSRDSVHIVLSDSATSLNDTIVLKYREPRKTKRRNDTPEPELNKLQSLVTSQHPFFDTMRVRLEIPSAVTSFDSIPLMLLDDSTVSYARFQLKADSTVSYSPQSLTTTADILPYEPLKQAGKYTIKIGAKLFRDLYGRYNDSLAITTTVTSAEDYGTLSLELKKISTPLNRPVIQLLNDKNTTVSQQTPIDSKVTFSNLPPATYRVRLFEDIDGNGQWTPGDYYLHRQPEPMFYFQKNLQLRSNWEMSETWELNPVSE